ncbi:hypothetical protein ACLOJK_026081 [Asimina triloba]
MIILTDGERIIAERTDLSSIQGRHPPLKTTGRSTANSEPASAQTILQGKRRRGRPLMGRTFPDSRRADEVGPARTRAEERRLDSLDDGVESRGGKKSKERGGERREEQPGEGRGGEEEKTGRSR